MNPNTRKHKQRNVSTTIFLTRFLLLHSNCSAHSKIFRSYGRVCTFKTYLLNQFNYAVLVLSRQCLMHCTSTKGRNSRTKPCNQVNRQTIRQPEVNQTMNKILPGSNRIQMILIRIKQPYNNPRSWARYIQKSIFLVQGNSQRDRNRDIHVTEAHTCIGIDIEMVMDVDTVSEMGPDDFPDELPR